MPKTDPNPTTDEQARLAVLDAIARTPELFDAYVLKGGLALHLAHGSPRRSHDLDFNSIEKYPREITEGTSHHLVHFGHALEDALQKVAADYGFTGMAVQRKELSDEIPTMLAEIGYGLETGTDAPFARAVEMQVTLCELVCATTEARVGAIRVRVPVLEDVLAEKLKALAQKVHREGGSSRASDVFDLWYYTTRAQNRPDAARLRQYVLDKCADLPHLNPTAALFREPEVREGAIEGYEDVAQNLPDELTLPPFDEAFAVVLRLVDTLEL